MRRITARCADLATRRTYTQALPDETWRRITTPQQSWSSAVPPAAIAAEPSVLAMQSSLEISYRRATPRALVPRPRYILPSVSYASNAALLISGVALLPRSVQIHCGVFDAACIRKICLHVVGVQVSLSWVCLANAVPSSIVTDKHPPAE